MVTGLANNGGQPLAISLLAVVYAGVFKRGILQEDDSAFFRRTKSA